MKDLIGLEDYKTQASLLLKAARSSDLVKKEQAIERIQSVFKISLLPSVKLKHALATIAHENGFNSWTDLKICVQQSTEKAFEQFFTNGFLNKWFANYTQAKLHQCKERGYLLPHKHQFFICEAPYIQNMGLDPEDPDWELIGWDWVNPGCKKAKERLLEKWVRARKSK